MDGVKCIWRNETNTWVSENDGGCREHISYYQWIPYVLIIQVNIFRTNLFNYIEIRAIYNLYNDTNLRMKRH